MSKYHNISQDGLATIFEGRLYNAIDRFKTELQTGVMAATIPGWGDYHPSWMPKGIHGILEIAREVVPHICQRRPSLFECSTEDELHKAWESWDELAQRDDESCTVCELFTTTAMVVTAVLLLALIS